VWTVGKWTRLQSIWAAVFTVGAAGAELSGPLGQKWLTLAGCIAAVVGAIGSVVFLTGRSRIEGLVEDVELVRRLRIPVTAVADLDPCDIGVAPAASTAESTERVPTYVVRLADEAIASALRDAALGVGKWLVVVEGPSKVGKSRSLIHALGTCPQTRGLVNGHLEVAVFGQEKSPPPCGGWGSVQGRSPRLFRCFMR